MIVKCSVTFTSENVMRERVIFKKNSEADVPSVPLQFARTGCRSQRRASSLTSSGSRPAFRRLSWRST